jgi:disulfide oxidoreductase YuzD
MRLFSVDLEKEKEKKRKELVTSIQQRALFYTLIVLSAPPVINRVPVTSNVEQNTPASASSEPGWGTSSIF